VPGDERDGLVAVLGIARQRLQLQLEALGDVAGADAGGLEVLHVAQRDLQLLDLDVGNRGAGGLTQLLELALEVAVLVEVADDDGRQLLVALGEAGERQLLHEVVLQRGLEGGELGEIVAVVILAPRAAAGGRMLLAEAVLLGEARRLVARLFGGGGGGRDFLGRGDAGRGWGRRFVARSQVRPFEQRVLREVALQLLVQLDRRQLQQPDGLLQLGREREVLR
jgi:hypothetical protein